METLATAAEGTRDAAAPPRRGMGFVLMLLSSASNQAGAAIGTMAFPVTGPVGVVAVRQIVAALVLLPTVRPRLRGLRADQWWPIVGLAAVFSVMNLCLYGAIERIGLGLAVTLEFLGPLTVAALTSRRAVDLAGAAMACAGVVVLTNPGPSTDVVGIALSLAAATAWGCYILLNRALGRRLPGLHGTAVASLITAGTWVPIALLWFASHPPTAAALALAALCGLMSSTVPYVADLLALRRVPAHLFGVFTSINPIWAALAGWLLLSQPLDAHEWAGIGLIVISNGVVSSAQVRRRPA